MHVARVAATAVMMMLAGPDVPGRAQSPAGPALTVFAASDLGPPFRQLVPMFEQETRTKVTLVLGSTGMLAQQIRNGAPADVFFAANDSFVRDLAAEALTVQGTDTVYARGRIATVTLRANGVRIGDLKDRAGAQVKRMAIANPQHAPYGRAARQALEAAGLWQTLQPKLVFGENVQQAVQFVRSGSAEAGIVARSVAGTSDLEWTLVSDQLHAPLIQMAAAVARTTQRRASLSFIEFVNSPRARTVMRQFGFVLPDESF